VVRSFTVADFFLSRSIFWVNFVLTYQPFDQFDGKLYSTIIKLPNPISQRCFQTLQAVNPDVKVNIGQTIALTCEIDVKVLKKDIEWSKGETLLTAGISRDRCVRNFLISMIDRHASGRSTQLGVL
jgi:hypothetical protein